MGDSRTKTNETWFALGLDEEHRKEIANNLKFPCSCNVYIYHSINKKKTLLMFYFKHVHVYKIVDCCKVYI